MADKAYPLALRTRRRPNDDRRILVTFRFKAVRGSHRIDRSGSMTIEGTDDPNKVREFVELSVRKYEGMPIEAAIERLRQEVRAMAEATIITPTNN